MVLPPGMDQATFNRAAEAFRRIVGNEWVHVGDRLKGYEDPFPIIDKESSRSSIAVAPANVEQVQQILRAANEFNFPLWPVSTGRNIVFGGASPAMTGTGVLDLKRMNRIIEVNEASGYALVEPGVSYFDLYNYLQENNIQLWIDPPSPGWGSPIGNTLERGMGYSPYGDHLMMQCGMEVVLPDGDIVRTGMGGVPDSNMWQLFKYGFGPYVDGMFTQSSYGVVTKMGVWLMPKPPGYFPYMVTFEKEEDLAQIIEIIRPLRLSTLIPNAAVLCNNLLDLAITTTREEIYTGAGRIPPSVHRRVNEEHRLGMWNFFGALYGPPDIMNASWAYIRDAFSQVPGAKFYSAEDRKGDPAFEYRAQAMQGIPHLTEFSVLNWYGPGGGHIDLTLLSPVTGDHAVRQYEMQTEYAAKVGYDYLGEFIVGWRDMHHINFMIFNHTDPEDRQRVYDLYERLTIDSGKLGYASYRTHVKFQNLVRDQFGYNDFAMNRLQMSLKNALDPKGILAPGKAGLWPDRYKQFARGRIA